MGLAAEFVRLVIGPGFHLERWGTGELAAVDGQRGAGDESGLVGAEPDDGCCDFLGLADALQGHRRRGCRLGGVAGASEVVGQDRARRHSVYAHAETRVIECGDLGKAFDAVFGRHVARKPADGLSSGG
jgi:hypothetical protein